MIINITKKTILVRHPLYEAGFWGRCRGMIKKDFVGFDGMVLAHCSSIHTCFMSIDLDVVFVDRDNRVCGIRHGLKPWRFAAEATARAVIELPEGMLDKVNCEVGDYLDLDAVLTDEIESSYSKTRIIVKPVISCKCDSLGDKR